MSSNTHQGALGGTRGAADRDQDQQGSDDRSEGEDEQAGSGEELGEIYTVEGVLDYRCADRFQELPQPYPVDEERYEVKYLVKWLGYDKESDHTWEPATNFCSPEDCKEFWTICERSKLSRGEPSHAVVVEEVRTRNQEYEEEKKRENEKGKAKSKPTKGKRKREPERPSSAPSASTSTASNTSKKPRVSSNSRAGTTPSLSSAELRRLRGGHLNQTELNELIEAAGTPELKALRFTPPPSEQRKARQRRRGMARSESGTQEERTTPKRSRSSTGQFAKEDRKGKRKAVEQESKPRIAKARSATEEQVSQRLKKSGFASDGDSDDGQQEEEESRAQPTHRAVKPEPTSKSPAPMAANSSKRASGFAEDEDDDEDSGDERRVEAPAVLDRARRSTTASRAPVASGGFAGSSDEGEMEAEAEEAPRVRAKQVSDSGFAGSTKTGFASDSDEDDGPQLEAPSVGNTTIQHLPSKGAFAASSDDDDEEEEEDLEPRKRPPRVSTDDQEGKGASKLAEGGGSASIRGKDVVEDEKTLEGKGKEKEQTKTKGRSASEPSRQTKDNGEYASTSKSKKRSSLDGGRHSPPPSKKTKTKSKSNVEVDSRNATSKAASTSDTAQSKTLSQKDALKKLKIGRISKEAGNNHSAEARTAGTQRSPSVGTNSTADQLSNSHGSGPTKKHEEDPFNYGVRRPMSKDGYIQINSSVLQFKKLPESICGKENPKWPLGMQDQHRIRWWWQIGRNPLVNFVDFDRVLANREVYVTPPPSQKEIGTNKRAAAHEKDYLALQLVLAHIDGVKQADSIRPAVSAVFVHASLADELGRFPGKLSELDHIRGREDVVCMFYGTGDDKQRALRQFWKPATAITFTPSALLEDPRRLCQLLERASSNYNEFDGTRDQFPFMVPQYLLPGGALGFRVDGDGKIVERSATDSAPIRSALEHVYPLLRKGKLPLTSVGPPLENYSLSQARFPSYIDRTQPDPAVWKNLSRCYPPKFCNFSLERLQKVVCTWRSQYAGIRRWIIIGSQKEIDSLGPAPGMVLATIQEAEALLEKSLAMTVG